MPRKSRKVHINKQPTRKSPVQKKDLHTSSPQPQQSVIGNIGQGMTLGAGAAIGSSMVHGAINSLGNNEESVSNTNNSVIQNNNNCFHELKNFKDCSQNHSDLNLCRNYLDFYTKCMNNNLQE